MTKPTPTTWLLRSTIVVLALIAPIAVVIGLRLAFHSCILLNPLGLPWPEPLRTFIQVLVWVVVLASTAGIVVGYARRELRAAAIIATVISVVAILPAFFAFFLTLYGDPGPNCVVG